MLTSVRSLMAATVLAGAAFTATPALAQEVSISGNAAIVSEYRFRGVDLSGGDIAVQGGVDVGLPAGFYVGTWGSSIDEDTVGYGHTELDVYGGWSGDLTSGISADVGIIAYLYPNAGAGDFDYIEFYGSLGAALGPAEVSVGIAYAPEQDSLDFDGIDDESDDNLYLFVDAGVGIPESPISLSAHLGYTEGVLSFKSPDDDSSYGSALDWSIGVDVALGDVASVGLAYVGAEGDDPAPGDYDMTDDAVVLTLAASF